jgi:hypothetical protein
MAESVVGGVVGGVMHAFAPSEPQPPAPVNATTFSSALSQATGTHSAFLSGASHTLRADDWNQMSTQDQQTWAKGLTGRHVDATDATGHTYNGIVGGVHPLGDTLALSIGGHLVSLSQLKQITWSSSSV